MRPDVAQTVDLLKWPFKQIQLPDHRGSADPKTEEAGKAKRRRLESHGGLAEPEIAKVIRPYGEP